MSVAIAITEKALPSQDTGISSTCTFFPLIVFCETSITSTQHFENVKNFFLVAMTCDSSNCKKMRGVLSSGHGETLPDPQPTTYVGTFVRQRFLVYTAS